MPDQTPAALWRSALSELELQMTKATFNSWLKDTRFLALEGETLLIACRGEYAQDWLTNRLLDTVNRTLRALSDDKVLSARFVVVSAPDGEKRVVAFVNEDGQVMKVDGDRLDTGSVYTRAELEDVLERFSGFEPPRTNFIPLPRQVVDVVMVKESPTVLAFVLAVIAHTMGVIENYRTRAMREWWEVSNPEVMTICNMSRNSFYMARRQALVKGYIVMKKGQVNPCYRPRFMGEPVDNSVDNLD